MPQKKKAQKVVAVIIEIGNQKGDYSNKFIEIELSPATTKFLKVENR